MVLSLLLIGSGKFGFFALGRFCEEKLQIHGDPFPIPGIFVIKKNHPDSRHLFPFFNKNFRENPSRQIFEFNIGMRFLFKFQRFYDNLYLKYLHNLEFLNV